MTEATKKKHVAREVTDSYLLPEGDQEIVQILRSCGNNLHEIRTVSGEQYLVSMPSKFRRSIWIKRGDYVIVTPIEEGNKVRAEIFAILLKHQIAYIKECGAWPFDANTPQDNEDDDDGSNEDEDEEVDELLVPNMNRVQIEISDDDDDEDEEEDEEDEEEEDKDSNFKVENGSKTEVNDNLRKNEIESKSKLIPRLLGQEHLVSVILSDCCEDSTTIQVDLLAF